MEVVFGESSSKVLILSKLMKLKAFTYLMKKQKDNQDRKAHLVFISRQTMGTVSQLR